MFRMTMGTSARVTFPVLTGMAGEPADAVWAATGRPTPTPTIITAIIKLYAGRTFRRGVMLLTALHNL
jgi:hypothetical protein